MYAFSSRIFSLAGNEDSKIYVEDHANEDKLRFFSEGQQRMIISNSTDSGNIGIGLNFNNPTSTLDIQGNLSVSKSIGIGTTTPTKELEIIGNINIKNGSYYKNGVLFTGGGGSLWDEGTNNHIYYNDGNIGIGTNAPQTKLDVRGSVSVNNLTLASGSITDSSGAISFGDENISTTGTLGAGVATLASGSTIGNLTLSNGSITDSNSSISLLKNTAAVTVDDDGTNETITFKTNNTDRFEITNSGHLLPKANASYDIGSAEYKIRHLFLSDNSLWVGDQHKLSIDNSGEFRVIKRKKNIVPPGIQTQVNEKGHNNQQIVDFVKNNITGRSDITSIDEMLLSDWLTYSKASNGLNINTEVSIDILYPDTDSFDDDLTSTLKVENNLTVSGNGIFSDKINIGNLTLADGSITDSSGTISFGDENISTTGTLGAGVATLAAGSTIGNLLVNTNNKVGIGTNNPSTILDVNGHIKATGIYEDKKTITINNPGWVKIGKFNHNTECTFIASVEGSGTHDAIEINIQHHVNVNTGITIKSTMSHYYKEFTKIYIENYSAFYSNERILWVYVDAKPNFNHTFDCYLTKSINTPSNNTNCSIPSLVHQTTSPTNGTEFSIQDNSIVTINYNHSILNGNVGIRTNSPTYPLHVVGSAGNMPSMKYFNSSSSGLQSGGSDSITIYVGGNIYASGLIAASDSRIKTNIEELVDNEALVKFRQLKPCKYNYIDTLNRTPDKVYGFIAQEVQEIMPYASSILPSSKYIPNIYKGGIYNNNVITFTENHNLDSDGNIKLILPNNKEIIVPYTIVDTLKINIDISVLSDDEKPSNNLVQDEDGNNLAHNIFVYGTEVDDFHTLNKDAIWTTAAAALQEVDRIQQADAVKIQTLETKVSTLESQLADLLARVTALESN